MDNLLAYNKFTKLPKELQSEVMDFMDFLLSKEKKKESFAKPRLGGEKSLPKKTVEFDDPMEKMDIPVEHQAIVLDRVRSARQNPDRLLNWDEASKKLTP